MVIAMKWGISVGGGNFTYRVELVKRMALVLVVAVKLGTAFVVAVEMAVKLAMVQLEVQVAAPVAVAAASPGMVGCSRCGGMCEWAKVVVCTLKRMEKGR